MDIILAGRACLINKLMIKVLVVNRNKNFKKLDKTIELKKFFFLRKLKDKTKRTLLAIIKGTMAIIGKGNKPVDKEKILGKKLSSNPAETPK